MSLKTWKEEFYSVPASKLARSSVIKCLEHSILKWRGLFPSHLKRHKVSLNGNEVCSDMSAEKFPFWTSNSTPGMRLVMLASDVLTLKPVKFWSTLKSTEL